MAVTKDEGSDAPAPAPSEGMAAAAAVAAPQVGDDVAVLASAAALEKVMPGGQAAGMALSMALAAGTPLYRAVLAALALAEFAVRYGGVRMMGLISGAGADAGTAAPTYDEPHTPVRARTPVRAGTSEEPYDTPGEVLSNLERCVGAMQELIERQETMGVGSSPALHAPVSPGKRAGADAAEAATHESLALLEEEREMLTRLLGEAEERAEEALARAEDAERVIATERNERQDLVVSAGGEVEELQLRCKQLSATLEAERAERAVAAAINGDRELSALKARENHENGWRARVRQADAARAAAERQGMESARQLREVSVKLEEAKREVRALMEAAESSAAASARARDAAAKDLDRARQQRLTEVQAAEERVVMAEARAEALAREIEALDREHEALLADTRRERAKVEGRSAQGVADAKAETDALRLQLQASETRLDRAMTAGREATAQTAAERARTVDVERELEVARALCSELKSERDSLERRIEVAEAEAAQRVANASKARAEAESEAAKATLTLATKASELNGLQAELEVLKRSGGASAEAARTAQAARQASDEALRSARTEADNAAARARALEDEATSARQSAAQAQAKRDTAESELASLRAKLEAAEEAVRASDARAALAAAAARTDAAAAAREASLALGNSSASAEAESQRARAALAEANEQRGVAERLRQQLDEARRAALVEAQAKDAMAVAATEAEMRIEAMAAGLAAAKVARAQAEALAASRSAAAAEASLSLSTQEASGSPGVSRRDSALLIAQREEALADAALQRERCEAATVARDRALVGARDAAEEARRERERAEAAEAARRAASAALASLQSERAGASGSASVWNDAIEERIADAEARGMRAAAAEREAARLRVDAEELRRQLDEATRAGGSSQGGKMLTGAESDRLRAEREALRREVDAANMARKFAEERALKAEMMSTSLSALPLVDVDADQPTVPGLEAATLTAIEQQLASLESMLEKGERRLADIESPTNSSSYGGAPTQSTSASGASTGVPSPSWSSMANPIYTQT